MIDERNLLPDVVGDISFGKLLLFIITREEDIQEMGGDLLNHITRWKVGTFNVIDAIFIVIGVDNGCNDLGKFGLGHGH